MKLGSWLFIIACFILLSGSHVGNPEPESQSSRCNSQFLPSVEPDTSIEILSDAEFESHSLSGNGTVINPYVISGLNLSCDVFCVRVENTRAHFVIANSTFSSFNRTIDTHLIEFYNVSNGIVNNCNISNGYYGVYIDRADWIEIMNCNFSSLISRSILSVYSSDIEIVNCTSIGREDNPHSHFTASSSSNIDFFNCSILYGHKGIEASFSNSTSVFHSTILNTTSAGINYGDTFDGAIDSNTIVNHEYSGVIPVRSERLIIERNNITSSSEICIDLGDCVDCIIRNNILTSDSDPGLEIFHGYNCQIEENEFYGTGVFLFYGDGEHQFSSNLVNSKPLGYFRFFDSAILDASYYGQIVLFYPSDVVIASGSISNTYCPIYIRGGTNVRISNLTLNDCSYGIYSTFTNSIIVNNVSINNGKYGISIFSHNINISNCNISNMSRAGIDLSPTESLQLRRCIASSCLYGISIRGCPSLIIEFNEIINVDYYGIRISSCSNFVLKNNLVVSNNLWYGIYISDSEFGTIENNSLLNCGFYIYGWGESMYNHTLVDNTVNSQPVLHAFNIANENINCNDYGQILISYSTNCILYGGLLENCSIGVSISYCNNCTVSNTTIHNSIIGVNAWITNECLFDNITIDGARYGFGFTGSTNGTLFNSRITNTHEYDGLWLTDCDMCIVENTRVINSTLAGIYLDASDDCKLIHNWIEGNGDHGIIITNRRNIVFGNTIVNNSGDGIRVRSWDSSIFSNRIYDNQCYGIEVNGYCEGNTFSHNAFMNNALGDAIDDGLNSWQTNSWWELNSSQPLYIPGEGENIDLFPRRLSVPDYHPPIVKGHSQIWSDSSFIVQFNATDELLSHYEIFSNGVLFDTGLINTTIELDIEFDGAILGYYNITGVFYDQLYDCTSCSLIIILESENQTTWTTTSETTTITEVTSTSITSITSTTTPTSTTPIQNGNGVLNAVVFSITVIGLSSIILIVIFQGRKFYNNMKTSMVRHYSSYS